MVSSPTSQSILRAIWWSWLDLDLVSCDSIPREVVRMDLDLSRPPPFGPCSKSRLEALGRHERATRLCSQPFREARRTTQTVQPPENPAGVSYGSKAWSWEVEVIHTPISRPSPSV